MEIKEMIEVLEAFERCGRVQYRPKIESAWIVTTAPQWDFAGFEYRPIPKPSLRFISSAKPEPWEEKMFCECIQYGTEHIARKDDDTVQRVWLYKAESGFAAFSKQGDHLNGPFFFVEEEQNG